MHSKNQVDPSVYKLWNQLLLENSERSSETLPTSFYFCDNKKDADECLKLVLEGIKRATATSLWWYEHHEQPIPQKGELYIITTWEGIAKCIVEVTSVEIVAFKEVTAAFARTEGEGDKSLSFWREVHQAYYERELKQHNATFSEEMMIVCECFRLVKRMN